MPPTELLKLLEEETRLLEACLRELDDKRNGENLKTLIARLPLNKEQKLATQLAKRKSEGKRALEKRLERHRAAVEALAPMLNAAQGPDALEPMPKQLDALSWTWFVPFLEVFPARRVPVLRVLASLHPRTFLLLAAGIMLAEGQVEAVEAMCASRKGDGRDEFLWMIVWAQCLAARGKVEQCSELLAAIARDAAKTDKDAAKRAKQVAAELVKAIERAQRSQR